MSVPEGLAISSKRSMAFQERPSMPLHALIKCYKNKTTMKKVFILSLFIPAMAGAQGPAAPFTLVGRLGNYNAPAKVYFDHMEGDVAKTDSAVLVDGAFRFSGQLPGPSAVRMSFTPRGDGKERAIYTGDVIYFYIGSENILIASKDSLAGAVITGSAINDQYEAYNKFIGGSIMALTK